MFNNAGRLKVNMGNIYFKLGQYAKAIKFYRMALDQVLFILNILNLLFAPSSMKSFLFERTSREMMVSFLGS